MQCGFTRKMHSCFTRAARLYYSHKFVTPIPNLTHTIDWLKAPFFPLHAPAHESWEMALLFRWHHILQCHCNVNADTHLYKVNKRNTRPQMPQKHFGKQRGDHTGASFPAFTGSVSYSKRGDVQAWPPSEVRKPFATWRCALPFAASCSAAALHTHIYKHL